LPAEAYTTSSPVKPSVWTYTSSFHAASLVSHQQPDVPHPRRTPAESEAAAASDAGTNQAQPPSSNDIPDDTKIVLYKGRYMQTFRLLVRFKIFQLVGIAALAIPINTFLMEVRAVQVAALHAFRLCSSNMGTSLDT